MVIKAERIQNTLKNFSFPRLSGTKYEKRAFKLAKEKIESLDLDPKIQNFKFSTFYSRIYPKITFSLVFYILFIIFINLNILFLIVNIIIVIGFYLPLFIITRKPENIKLGKVLESQNIYVKFESDLNRNRIENNFEARNIIFLAHLDSKGQRFVGRIRFLSVFTWTLSLITLAIILILRNIFFTSLFSLLNIIAISPLLINFLATLILVFNTTNNQSKGVVDNAAGVASLIELLTHFSKNMSLFMGFNVYFVLTGAEETGTMGIRLFYNIIKDLSRKKTIVLNFESLGQNVGIFISKNNLEYFPNFYKLFEKKAQRYGFRTWVSSIRRGVHTDGIYLYRKDFSLYELGSTEAGRYMHSKYDSLENVNIMKLKKVCDFIVEQLEDYIR